MKVLDLTLRTFKNNAQSQSTLKGVISNANMITCSFENITSKTFY